MKQNSYTFYHPYSGEIALSASIHAFYSRAAMILRTWNQRIEQRNVLGKLSSHLLADTGISEARRLAEVNRPFWRA